MIIQSVIMASNSPKTPPPLSKRPFTNLPASTQRSALALSLEDEALDAVLEIDNEDIAKENGVDAITERLNRLFKKDSTITKYQALEPFEAFRRPASIKLNHMVQFSQMIY